MELLNPHLVRHGRSFAAYQALQRQLLSRHLARGGTMEEWCQTLAPAFRRKYGFLAPGSLDC